eukprot:3916870-Prymnesium_polylepis.1
MPLLCSSHKFHDTSVASCEPWCAQADHCEFCKCRVCEVCLSRSPAPPGSATLRLALPADALKARASVSTLAPAQVPEGLPSFCTAPDADGRLRVAVVRAQPGDSTPTTLALRGIN